MASLAESAACCSESRKLSGSTCRASTVTTLAAAQVRAAATVLAAAQPSCVRAERPRLHQAASQIRQPGAVALVAHVIIAWRRRLCRRWSWATRCLGIGSAQKGSRRGVADLTRGFCGSDYDPTL